MRKLLILTAVAIVTAAVGQAAAQASELTAVTPGLQIMQLRVQAANDLQAIAKGYKTRQVFFNSWIQQINERLTRENVRERTRHLEWATRKLKRLWAQLGNVSAWSCIHRYEGAWNDSGDPYWGGLQMDKSFQRHYGSDMIRHYGGFANIWHPYDQMIVAQRAYNSGRGYFPWPNTARYCHLI